MDSIVLYNCYLTIGEPYEIALREIQEGNQTAPGLAYPTSKDDASGLAAQALSGGIVREDAFPPVWTEEDHEGLSLPNPYLPGLIPLVSLLGTVLAHILMLLCQVWFVSVLTFLQYYPARSLDEADVVRVVPKSFRGKATLVALERHQLQDKSFSAPFFMFQKRKYVAVLSDDDESVLFQKVKPPIRNALKQYCTSTGFQSTLDFQRTLDFYGKNEFSIPQPTFMAMYKQQLIEPLTVFQLFSVLLWVLDEYWQYPLFTLAMILLFEGVTVLSRLKNLSTLRGMGNEKIDVYVYRCKNWISVKSEQLVPGDIASVRRGKEGSNVVPCDCLLIKGSAVLNEATLTGESIPQMKEGLGSKVEDVLEQQPLDIKSLHKVHVLYGGTTMMQHDANASIQHVNIPTPPDTGCIVYVLRTGFCASQGKLVRMIEYSSGKVTGSTKDALGLALLLLVFAIMSSTYVLRQGMADKGKVTFELLLRCVLIITSVIPAELPMQTALAVNSALLTLVKKAVFCTEPFRISLAGKVDICLFDKTGTITTDQLTAIGITSWDPNEASSSPSSSSSTTTAVSAAELAKPEAMIRCSVDAAMVIAGCHSLVKIDDKIVGDPVEEASIRAIDFVYNANTKTSTPKPFAESEKAMDRHWAASTDMSSVSVTVLHRNHFASKLQRMSVIAKVNTGVGKTTTRALVKGSPEAIKILLRNGACPPWYDEVYQRMARRGMRILALAYKTVDECRTEADIAHQPRSWAESDLLFAGFAAFRCLVRKDSAQVIQLLKDSSHDVTMITGDAVLTAIHVAREVAITTQNAAILTERDDHSLVWQCSLADGEEEENDGHKTDRERRYSSSTIVDMARTFDLCVTGKTLLAAARVDDVIWSKLEYIRVYARMTPELKERVMINLKKHGHHTLMAGDGANDVGALKQSDIGVALLSGFGAANAGKGESELASSSTKGSSKYRKTVADNVNRDALGKLHVSVLKKRLTSMAVEHTHCREKSELVDLLIRSHAESKTALMKTNKKSKMSAKRSPHAPLSAEEKKELMQKKQDDIEADVRAREARGESFARVRALAAFAKREAEEAKQKQKARGSGFAAHANNATMQKYFDDFEEGELPMVKLGDASIASPFTSRAPSIQATVDIIRQGRCALVTTMQMYQILAVNCLISSYSLSVLYLDRVKYGNAQMIALGMISTVASLTLSKASPLEKLSPVRPLTTIFHPALFFSLIGQFALHLGCMIFATRLAKQYTSEDDTKHSVRGGEFEPNIMSTVVFLINAVQTVSVCAVNYKGRPFMKGMADNPGLLYSLGASFIGVFLAATEAMPLFNKTVQIVPMPDIHFTRELLLYLSLDVFGAFLWDQLCLFVFAPQIFMASVRSINVRDVRQLVKMTLFTFVLIYIFSNIDYEELERQQKLMEEASQAVDPPLDTSVGLNEITI